MTEALQSSPNRTCCKLLVREMTERVGKWYEIVRACGVSERDAETIRGAFLYPGLFYELADG
jgi:serine/threonine-protein kinase HipA